MQRRLSAILAADMVGYSRLMAADERGTIARQKEHRAALIDPMISEYGGRIVKTMGDGLLVEFPSAVDAVECALEIQRGMAKRDGEMDGDISIDGDDVLGDGVNVASRLEGLAMPGGICISGSVYETLQGKLAEPFLDIGEQALKNINRKIRAWQWAPEQVSTFSGRARSISEKPSIAVLPFTNMSGDPDQEYFTDGITEDLTTELSRFGSLRVLARHSTFVLRDQAENVRKEIEALGADYLLEGSVRRAGDQIRLTAQLVDVSSQKHIWAHRYDRKLSEVFAIQDELVHAIVATLVGRVEASSLDRAFRKPPESLAAYDYYLRGLWYDRKYDPSCSADGVAVLEKAIALDPTFARAYGLLATSMMMSNWHEGSLEAASEECLSMAKKAVELDLTPGDCFAKLGIVHLDRREYEEARRNLEKALKMNPHEPSTWSHYAWYLVANGEPEKALEYLDRREAIDPYPPNWNADLRAEALYDLGRYGEAAYVLEQKPSPYPYNYGQLAACYGQMGRKEEAAECWARYLQGTPDATIASVGKANSYKHQADLEHWTEGLLKAGLSD